MMSPILRKPPFAPTSEVLPATDVVVVGVLHDVTVARAGSSPASGTKQNQALTASPDFVAAVPVFDDCEVV